MPFAAWIMTVFAFVFLGGGLIWSIERAKKGDEINEEVTEE